jgi:hypothetical protein
MRNARYLTGVVGTALYATLAAGATPQPPPQVCVNGTCSSPASQNASTSIPLPGAIKWHPGHYMESAAFTSASNTQKAAIAGEVSTVRSGPSQVIGYAMISYWNTFENNTAGAYDFSLLDSTYAAVTGYQSGSLSSTVYNNPKRFILWVQHENYFSKNPTDYLPTYLINTSAYGSSPTSGQYGWWTGVGSSGGQGAIWRSAVMSRLIALGHAICSHKLPDGYTVDASPYFEALFTMQSETAARPPASDASFTTAGFVSEMQALNLAMEAACPHTMVGSINNYAPDTGSTNSITQNGATTLTAGADGDTFGLSSGTTPVGALQGLTWGQYSFIGGYGGIDLRGKLPFLASVQSTEVGDQTYFAPQDLYNQANQTLHATHMLWANVTWETGAHVQGNYLGSATSLSQWQSNPSGYGGMLYIITENSLSHTACPSLFTQGCNTN